MRYIVALAIGAAVGYAAAYVHTHPHVIIAHVHAEPEPEPDTGAADPYGERLANALRTYGRAQRRAKGDAPDGYGRA